MSKMQIEDSEDLGAIAFQHVEPGSVFKTSYQAYIKPFDGELIGAGYCVRLCDGQVEFHPQSELVWVAKSAKMEIVW